MTIDKAIFLQILNGFVAVTATMGSVVFMRYIYKNWALGYQVLRPAIAINAVFIGCSILYSAVFIHRVMLNAGYPSPYPFDLVLVGGGIVEIAFLCKIRVFSPDHWGIWPLGLTILVASAVVALSFAFVFFHRL